MTRSTIFLQALFHVAAPFKRPVPAILLAALLALGVIAPLYAASSAATIPVDVLSDSDLNAVDDGNCTLREAVENANNGDAGMADCDTGSAGEDTITINLNGVITLTFGQLDVAMAQPLVIVGPGAGNLEVSANFTERVIYADSVPLTLTGFTVADGNADDDGGGVWVDLADLTLTDMRFVDNHSAGDGGGANAGGNVRITNSEFFNNSANLDGGGLYAAGIVTATGTLFSSNVVSQSGGGASVGLANFTAVTFRGNVAQEFGGGLEIFDRSFPSSLVDSFFESNTSQSTDVLGGGGGGAFVDSNITVANTDFDDNRSAVSGGGIHVIGNATVTNSDFRLNRSTDASGGAMFVEGNLTLTGGTMLSNTTESGGDGGAVRVNGTAAVTGGLFRNNRADGFGGAVHIVGAVAMTGSQLVSNTAASDGGGMQVRGNTSLNSVQFIGNSTNDDGGGFATAGAGNGKIVNSLFAHNASVDEGEALDFRAAGAFEVIHTTVGNSVPADGSAIYVMTSTVAITNSILSGYPVGIKQASGTIVEDYNLFNVGSIAQGTVVQGIHSLSGHPYFANPAANDFHLTAASAAIELGAALGITTDFENQTRPQGAAADMGYDESAFTLPTISVGNALITEGNAGATVLSFPLSLSTLRGLTTTVYYTTTDGTATAGSDYSAVANGVAIIPAGQMSSTIAINLTGDTVVEGNETLSLQIGGVQFATIVTGTATGTVINDDSTALSIADASIAEGNSGTTNLVFTIVLSQPSASQVTLNYATSDGTATAGSDYTSASGPLTFAPLQTSITIAVAVTGDATAESNENLLVTLSNVVGAGMSDGSAQGTILNDDGVTLSINDVLLTEGNAGVTNAVFTVSLNQASPQPVTVDFNTTDGTASAVDDYNAANGTLTFAPQQTTAVITVPVKGDTAVEPNETFLVVLGNPSNATIFDGAGLGTIRNDDGFVITINDAAKTEGNSGTSSLVFTVTLSQISPQTITVNYNTSNETAIAGSDYVTGTGVVTFAPSQTSVTITVVINGDTTSEPDERFTVKLNNVTLASIGDDTGVGTILDDDNARKVYLPIAHNSPPCAVGQCN